VYFQTRASAHPRGSVRTPKLPERNEDRLIVRSRERCHVSAAAVMLLLLVGTLLTAAALSYWLLRARRAVGGGTPRR
jgi:hypothetical protein